jgi:hypothetical protein
VAEMRKQEHAIDVKNATVAELAHGIVAEVKAAGKDIAKFVKEAVEHDNEQHAKGADRNGRSLQGTPRLLFNF